MTIYFFMIGSLLVGLLMLLRLRKEDKLYTFLGIGLILLSIWLFANDRLDGLLTTGWYAWVGRGVLVIVAFVLAYFFWQEENFQALQERKMHGFRHRTFRQSVFLFPHL